MSGIEYAGGPEDLDVRSLRSGSFPEEWGTPPSGTEERERWIRQHATAAEARRRLQDLNRRRFQ